MTPMQPLLCPPVTMTMSNLMNSTTLAVSMLIFSVIHLNKRIWIPAQEKDIHQNRQQRNNICEGRTFHPMQIRLQISYLIVWPSKVVMCGTPFSPNWALRTLQSLYCKANKQDNLLEVVLEH